MATLERNQIIDIQERTDKETGEIDHVVVTKDHGTLWLGMQAVKDKTDVESYIDRIDVRTTQDDKGIEYQYAVVTKDREIKSLMKK